jgi:hypothetical protein
LEKDVVYGKQRGENIVMEKFDYASVIRIKLSVGCFLGVNLEEERSR